MSGTTKRWLLDTAERTARTFVQGFLGAVTLDAFTRSGPDVGREHRDRAARRRIRRACRLRCQADRRERLGLGAARTLGPAAAVIPSAAGCKVGPRAANDSGPRRARAIRVVVIHSADREDLR